jgi:predicted XRE-type DNA-binding protein
MIPSNLNRCRFEILEIINRLERAQLSQSRIASSVGVGGGRGSWDVVGASQRGRIRTIVIRGRSNRALPNCGVTGR